MSSPPGGFMKFHPAAKEGLDDLHADISDDAHKHHQDEQNTIWAVVCTEAHENSYSADEWLHAIQRAGFDEQQAIDHEYEIRCRNEGFTAFS